MFSPEGRRHGALGMEIGDWGTRGPLWGLGVMGIGDWRLGIGDWAWGIGPLHWLFTASPRQVRLPLLPLLPCLPCLPSLADSQASLVRGLSFTA
jgi:hypothetical protein